MARSALEDLQEVLPVAEEILEEEESRAHLLLVDDDPQILKLCDWYLKAASPLGPEGTECEIHRAESGEEALRIVETLAAARSRIACAVLDVVLPGECDGIEIIRRIWETDPEVQCTLITGAGESIAGEIQGRIPAGCMERWDFLAKPFTEFEIVQRVRRALSNWFAHRREERRAGENLKLLLRLSRANRELEAKVRERTQALAERNEEQERKNAELERALRDLEAAQGKLVHQEKMASIGQLAAGVAHELNNPIGFVHSNLGTLRRYCGKIRTLVDAYEQRVQPGDEQLATLKRELKVDFVLEDLSALIEESLEGTERVRKIVADLKVFSHPDEGQAKFCNLNEGLSSTLNIVHNELKYKAEVITEFGEIPEVRCLPGPINQVFMNLLVNAGQAIEDQGEIRVATRREGDVVVISIRDSGCGIPPEVQGRIFDPFFTTKGVGKGTGLGLSISYDIVRKHGGSLTVESAVGSGTTFEIRLPIDAGEELCDAG